MAVTYAYDGEGSRVAQHSVSFGSAWTTAYLLGDTAETVEGTGTFTDYLVVPGVGTVVETNSPTTPTVSYLVDDGLHSVSVALDASGNVAGQALYFPYGIGRYFSGRFPTTHGFTGQDQDGNATGLFYDHARYYDPAIGQFASADPTSGSGLNAFAYVGDNPETDTDPSGTVRCEDTCATGFISRYTAQQWTQVIYQDAVSSPSAAATLYLWSHSDWLKAENYAENVQHTSLMYQTGLGAVAYMTPRVGQNWGAGGTSEMEEFALLQTARAWGVVGSTGSMYDGAHALSMTHSGGGGLGLGDLSGSEGAEARGMLGVGATGEGEGDGGGRLCGLSFAAATAVATPSGERAISSLRVGDAVEAYDPTTQTTSVQTVQHVFIDHDSDLLDVTLKTSTSTSSHTSTSSSTGASTAHGTADEVVHTTASHPWLTADRGWERAGELHVGEHVVTADGAAAVVLALNVVPGAADMWDLTVSNVHTFEVGTGAYVVHNCGIGGLPDPANKVPGQGKLYSGQEVDIDALKASNPKVTWTRTRQDYGPVTSDDFRNFLLSQGRSSSDWGKYMETWRPSSGQEVENHYWWNPWGDPDEFYHYH